MTNHSPRLRVLLAAAVAGLALHGPAQAIVGGTATTDFGQVGRGVLIAPNWVVTARHVALGIGSTYANGYGSSTVAATYTLSNGIFPEDDLALMRLNTAITAPQLSLLANEFTAGSTFDIAATITTASNQSPRGYAFTTVRDFMPVYDNDGTGPEPVVRTNWLYAYSADHGAPYVEGGDSGGGLFYGQHSGLTADTLLWGINSAQANDKNAQGIVEYGSLFVQLSSYRAWIDGTMAGDTADGQMANWVSLSAVPEETTQALLLAGLGLLAWRGRLSKHSRARQAR